ncbi:MAG: hypothetical protein RRY25_06575 [Anaerovorax sp.]
MKDVASKALGIGIAGALIGMHGYVLMSMSPKAHHEVERKLKRAANELNDMIDHVKTEMKSMS